MSPPGDRVSVGSLTALRCAAPKLGRLEQGCVKRFGQIVTG